MKSNHFFNSFDLVGQTLLIIPTMFAAISSVAVPSVFFLYLLGLFFLGGWQLLSAFSRFFFTQDLFLGWYFMASVTYCGFLILGFNLVDKFEIGSNWGLALGVYFIGIIPGIASIWYYKTLLNP